MPSFVPRALTALMLAATLSTSGCYALNVNAFDVEKPVSLSQKLGPKVRFARHFKHEFVTWYAFGMWPTVSLPSAIPAMTPANRIVATVLRDELQRGGDGIVNLKVTQSYNWLCWVANFVPLVLGTGVGVGLGSGPSAPGSSPAVPLGLLWVLALQPMAATLEGDVVSLVETADRPAPLVTLVDGQLDTDGLDIRQLVAASFSRRGPR